MATREKPLGTRAKDRCQQVKQPWEGKNTSTPWARPHDPEGRKPQVQPRQEQEWRARTLVYPVAWLSQEWRRRKQNEGKWCLSVKKRYLVSLPSLCKGFQKLLGKVLRARDLHFQYCHFVFIDTLFTFFTKTVTQQAGHVLVLSL